MDELDILKKHWKENQNFPKVSQDEIRAMIHKKSSSLVMWIFIISIIEFILLNVASYLIPLDSDAKNQPKVEHFLDKFEYISMGISLLFIFLFYTNYRKIKVYSSSKDLMSQIIRTKKTVNYYIYSNIFLVICGVGFSTYQSFDNQGSKGVIILVILFIILTVIITLIIWLFYKLVYGILLRRLSKNLKELQKIDVK